MKQRPSNGTPAPAAAPIAPAPPEAMAPGTKLRVPVEELTDADIKLLARQQAERFELDLRQERERMIALRGKAKKA